VKAFVEKWWLKVLIGFAVVVVAIQFVPYGVDNPPVTDGPEWDSDRTRELFDRACADCHSDRTNVLWFEHIAPVKWYVANHVKEGREALDVSTWHTDAGSELDDLTESIEEREMPPSYYTYFGLHPGAKLTDTESRQLIDGLKATVAADPPATRER